MVRRCRDQSSNTSAGAAFRALSLRAAQVIGFAKKIATRMGLRSHTMFTLSHGTGFLGLFVSATVLPGNSEIVLVAVFTKFPDLFWEASVVATIGNTLAGMTSYAIGRIFPNQAESRALVWIKRYGEWMLLLSWIPMIGDAMCVAAGWLRINTWLALLMLTVGKCARYLALAFGWTWFAATWLA